MTVLQKLCLGFSLFLTAIALLSYLPAINTYHWFLRVGVPEVGLILPVLALPFTLYLAKSFPKIAFGNLATLLIMVLVPWFQAWSIASKLPGAWKGTFALAPQRYPLSLAASGKFSQKTEEYKPGLSWDRYTPTDVPIRARILFVHGGSWRNGKRTDYSEMFPYLAGLGYEVFSLTYTLSGEAPYPAASHDVADAIAKAYDPEIPLFMAGRSSGGHLALLGAYTHPEKVRGVIGFYSPVDMVWSYEHPSNPRVLKSNEAIVQFLSGTPSERPQVYEEASPIDRVGEQGPATLLIHGGSDCLVFPKQSEMLSERLDTLKVKNFVLFLPWMEHGGDITLKGPSGRLAAWVVEGFVESMLTAER